MPFFIFLINFIWQINHNKIKTFKSAGGQTKCGTARRIEKLTKLNTNKYENYKGHKLLHQHAYTHNPAIIQSQQGVCLSMWCRFEGWLGGGLLSWVGTKNNNIAIFIKKNKKKYE